MSSKSQSLEIRESRFSWTAGRSGKRCLYDSSVAKLYTLSASDTIKAQQAEGDPRYRV